MTKKHSRDDIFACTELFNAYARTLDFGDYEGFVDLFTETAVLDVGRPVHGKNEIRQSVASRPRELRSRHLLCNIYINITDENRAAGIAYLNLYRHVGPASLTDKPVDLDGPSAIGHYDATFAKARGVWRIDHCQLHFAFKNQAHFPSPKRR